MSQNSQTRLHAIDRNVLTPLVQQALASPGSEILNWEQRPLVGGAGGPAGGILGHIHFFGQAQVQGQVVPWSLVLKAFAPPPGSSNRDQTAPPYWKREALTYQSGLLNALGGALVAPRCYAVVEYSEEEYWVWMEYIEETQKRWPIEHYQLAARDLGHFNGSYLVNCELPSYPWLNIDHLRQWVALGESGIQDLPRLSHHPMSWVTPAYNERTLRLYTEREDLLERLDQLPRCLCHHDVFRRNLLIRRAAQGEEQTVAIDWSAVGPGIIGEDLAYLVIITLSFLEVPMAEAARLEQLAFAGYLAGLRAAGWQGDEAVIRFSYAAIAALFQGLGRTGFLLPRIENEQMGTKIEQLLGYPYTQIQSQLRELHEYVLDLGDEAQTLWKQVTV